MLCKNKNEYLPTEEVFYLFQQLVYKKLGIDLPLKKRVMLGHRLIKRVRFLNAESFMAYYSHIIKPENVAELEHALELITTNETFFFREEIHFDFLQEKILPSISQSKELRIWSAASSTGEEPYSIAMLLSSYRYPAPWSLLASDVNKSVVAHAEKGIYINERTRLLPNKFRKLYCGKGTGEFEGHMRINVSLRNSINFFCFNLLDDMEKLGKFDLIFLRNVMIYFDDKTKQEIVSKISQVLNPGGWLFISHTETLHGIEHDFELIQPAIYQLKDREETGN
jgi:chemotaxis protein methyltransferase CheR